MPVAPFNDENLPFVRIRRGDDRYEVEGLAKCALGHQIERKGGKPDGIYATWNWDGQTLTITNDRYGFYPLFYSVDATSICVAPVISLLLRSNVDRTINDAAMAVFLRVGYFLAEDTPFLNIHYLPPGAELTWSREGFQLKCSGIDLRREASISRESALDGYIELFQKAMERRPPTAVRFVLPLSGGRDSRHIFLELCRKGWRPDHCITIDVQSETDSAVAVQLAGSQGTPINMFPRIDPGLDSEIRKNLETSFCSDEHTWSLGLADYLSTISSQIPNACSYDGLAGDVLSASRFINDRRQRCFETQDFVNLAAELISHSDRFTNNSLPGELRKRWSTEVALERAEKELRRYSEAPNPMAAFIFWNRTRREIALYSYGFLRSIPCLYAPFLDNDLYDHVAALPARMLLDRKFHDDAIRKAYPHAANIPYASKTERGGTSDAMLARLTRDVLASMVRAKHRTWIRPAVYGLGLIRSRVWSSKKNDALWLGSRCLYMLQLEQAWADGYTQPGKKAGLHT